MTAKTWERFVDRGAKLGQAFRNRAMLSLTLLIPTVCNHVID
jgi:hypothetical protein